MQPPPDAPHPAYAEPPPPAPGPPTAHRSPDGRFWWDGAQWQPVAGLAAAYASPAMWALIANLLIGVVGAATILSVLFDLTDISVLSQAVAGAKLSQADQDGLDLRAAGAGLLFLVAYIPAVVFFCIWIHRASRNLPALGATDQRYRPGWAVGWWFIPLANLVVPLMVVNEIWRGSDPSVGATDRYTRLRLPPHPLLGLWWAAWIGGNLISNLGTRVSWQSKTAGGALVASYIDVVGCLVRAAAAVLAVVVIRAITRWQEQKHTRMTAGELT